MKSSFKRLCFSSFFARASPGGKTWMKKLLPQAQAPSIELWLPPEKQQKLAA
jgi:hypothetical protein